MNWARGWLLALGASSILVVLPQAASAHGCPGANRPVTSTPARVLRRAVVCLINRERTERGLPALRANPRLNRSAQGWTAHLVHSHTFSHGSNFAARISAAGVRWSTAGENIATGFETPSKVVAGWMASAGHCRNILDPQFAEVGTGVSPAPTDAQYGAGTWTQDFALFQGSAAPSADWGPASACPY